MGQFNFLHKFGYAIEPIELVVFLIASWPAIITSIVVSVTGIVTRKVAWLAVGCVLYLPFSTLYLGGGPGTWYLALIFPLLQGGAILALKRNIAWLAWLLVAPVIIFTAWFASLVASQG